MSNKVITLPIKEIYKIIDKYLGYEPQSKEELAEFESILPVWKIIYAVSLDKATEYEYKG